MIRINGFSAPPSSLCFLPRLLSHWPYELPYSHPDTLFVLSESSIKNSTRIFHKRGKWQRTVQNKRTPAFFAKEM